MQVTTVRKLEYVYTLIPDKIGFENVINNKKGHFIMITVNSFIRKDHILDYKICCNQFKKIKIIEITVLTTEELRNHEKDNRKYLNTAN